MEAVITGWIVSLISSIGVIEWLFVIIVVALLYFIIKNVPVAFNRHIEAMDKMHDKFSCNLETISDKFVSSIDTLSREHERHYDKLSDIHNDVKSLKNK